MSAVKAKKKIIPKVMKDLCWSKYIGDTVGKTKCMCCETNEIKMNDFQCGHVIAEANGGTITVDNLRPICKACNVSMGTENLNEFKMRYGFKRVDVAVASASVVTLESEVVFWSPGMFSGLTKMPKYIKWQPGTNSIQMGQELQQYGYVSNKSTGLYELK